MERYRKGNGRQFYFYRRQLVILALAFALTALIILVFGIITGKNVARRGLPGRAASVVKIPVDVLHAESDSGDEAPPAENSGFENPSTEDAADREPPSEPELPANTAPAAATRLTVPVTGPVAEKSVAKVVSTPAASEERSSQPKEGEPSDRTWTVQVKSSPDKTYVERWVKRLKNKGYDAFMAEADIKGQIWYRLRVGHFAAREEAESFRNTLASEEGLSGAFLLQQTK